MRARKSDAPEPAGNWFRCSTRPNLGLFARSSINSATKTINNGISVGGKKAAKSLDLYLEEVAKNLPQGFQAKGNIYVFIDECHRQGMAVILDIVFNQSDGLHPWYMMYPASSNPFYNRTAPHEYSVLNDWNQDNALVLQQWTDALKYWMTAYNVDGYRFDLVKGLGDNDSYVAAGGTNQYNKSRVERMKRLHGVIKSVKPNGIHINENLAGAEEEIAMGEDGEIQWVNVNNSSCQYTMGYSSDCDLKIFLATAYGNRPAFSTVSYAESHDEQRMGYKNAAYGVEAVQGESLDSYRRLGSLAVQMLLTPGPKMVWQFGELGNSQNTKILTAATIPTRKL